jgi:hypothetical protein
MGLVGREIQKSCHIFSVEVFVVQFFQIVHKGIENLFSLGLYQQLSDGFMTPHFCTNIRNNVIDKISLSIFFKTGFSFSFFSLFLSGN